MGNMKTWWIFGYEPWGNLRPANMTTKDGRKYIPLFCGIWIKGDCMDEPQEIWVLETWYPSFTEETGNIERRIIPTAWLEKIKKDLCYNQRIRRYIPRERT
jgi:hypothetical protein